MTNIETGVDKLVSLVNQHKRISVQDAAKKLGVSTIVIQEWADFLQEEGIVDIEVKFAKTYLLEKRLSKEDIKKKAGEFSSSKDAFVRRVETALEGIDRDSLGLEKIKSEFNKMKKELGVELEKVQNELKELEKYESLKKGIDQDIIEQQAHYRRTIDQAHRQILLEEKKYAELIDSVKSEEAEMQKDEKQLKSLEDKEEELKKKVKDMYGMLEEVKARIGDQREKLGFTKQHIKNLENTAREVESIIQHKKKQIDPLLEKSKKEEKRIIQLQDKLLQKVMAKKTTIRSAAEEGREVTKNFNEFFNKKSEIEQMIQKLDEDKLSLKQELNEMIKKVKTFNLAVKSGQMDSNVVELKKELQRIDSKRNLFKDEINKLIELIKE